MKAIIIITILVTITQTKMVRRTFGTNDCPAVKLQPNFAAAKYMGTWFEQLRDKNIKFQDGDCTVAKYNLNADNSVLVRNSGYNIDTQNFSAIAGKLTFDGAFGHLKFFPLQPEGKYEVIATDYENFTVVYSCSTFLFVKSTTAYVLTRQQNPPQSIIDKALKMLQDQDPDYTLDRFRHTIQDESKCKYLD